MIVGLRGRGREVPEGGECWRGRWQLPRPDCLGGRVGCPSGDGVRGRSGVSCLVSRAGCALR